MRRRPDRGTTSARSHRCIRLTAPFASTGRSVVCRDSPLLPNAGPASGGNEVSITGSGFAGTTAVSFGGKSAAEFTVSGDDLIRGCRAAWDGTVPVTVTAAGSTQSVDDYTYVEVTSVSPTAARPRHLSAASALGPPTAVRSRCADFPRSPGSTPSASACSAPRPGAQPGLQNAHLIDSAIAGQPELRERPHRHRRPRGTAVFSPPARAPARSSRQVLLRT